MRMNNRQLSIIIPTHNSEDKITDCIKSLTSQSFSREKFEIIIVDDSSTDKSVDLAKKAGADNVIITNPCFPGKARNIGVDNSKTNLIAFLDSDCKAKEGWINRIIEELKTSYVVTGPIENGNKNSPAAWAEYFLEFGGYDEFRKRSSTQIFASCNFACTRDAFLAAGGFEDLRANEDYLFCKSVKKAGIEPLFVPEIGILHYCRTDIDKVSENMELLGRHFVKIRRRYPSIQYNFLCYRLMVPVVFFAKLFLSAKYSIRAKKIGKFLQVFPLVIRVTSFFCKGIWNELANSKNA